MTFKSVKKLWISTLVLTLMCFESIVLSKSKSQPAKKFPRVISWRQTGEFPHDPQAFTQGLEVWDKDYFLESTGHYGRSELRRVERRSGTVISRVSLDREYFAEGVTRLGDSIFQLTWREGLIFQWSFTPKRGFQLKSKTVWSGEAWGLTKGLGHLWVSDGSNKIYELDQKTLQVNRTVKVTLAGEDFDKLNELEFVRGRILANVFMSATVVIINPESGVIEAMMDLSSLAPKSASIEAIANGLAWDSNKKRLYATGKYWPKVFELSVDL